MRQIKTANIKVDAFPMAAAKKDAAPISKKNFMEQLESFLGKDQKTETKSNESNEVTTDETDTLESEEDFDAELNINLVDLNHLTNQPLEVKKEASLSEEVVDLQKFTSLNEEVPGVRNEELAFKLEDLLNNNLVSDSISNSIDEMQVEDLLLTLETQLSENPELEVEDVIEGLLSENKLNLAKFFKDNGLDTIEKKSQEELEPISTRIEPKLAENQYLEFAEDPEVKGIQDEVIEGGSIEQTGITTDSKISELSVENEVEAQAVELSSIETLESVNRIDVPTETSAPIQSVAQEDFVSKIETLMIEETESLDGGDKVTTARIQLTPDHLGKVDLQIEINGKELTAKLIVEQKETKEWIDQQVAHLKEKLLTQEITVKDFQIVVHEENLNDAFMNSEENPFFKQKEKDSQARKEQRLLKNRVTDEPVQREERSYSTRSGISILV